MIYAEGNFDEFENSDQSLLDFSRRHLCLLNEKGES